jgi:hypothetical protein
MAAFLRIGVNSKLAYDTGKEIKRYVVIERCERHCIVQPVGSSRLVKMLLVKRDVKEDHLKSWLRPHWTKDGLQEVLLPPVSEQWVPGIGDLTMYAKIERRSLNWTKLRALTQFLLLHSRAVVTANHPLRKLARGEFKEDFEGIDNTIQTVTKFVPLPPFSRTVSNKERDDERRRGKMNHVRAMTSRLQEPIMNRFNDERDAKHAKLK